jgi:hypothetical protein
MKFYWEDLLDGMIRDRKVVPVIGADLLGAAEPGGEIPFRRELAERTAGKLREAGLDSPPVDSDWAAFVDAALRRIRNRGDFTLALNEAHRELMAGMTDDALPQPLQLLAQITDFPLVLTTTTEGLVERALRIPEDEVLSCTVNETADLPINWQPPVRCSPPTLIHLFGKIAATPGFALTEEDLLEFMSSFQDERRPAQLLSKLKRSHILILGNRFPDWFARFFLRVLRGERLSLDNVSTFEAVAEPEARSSRPLVAFLQHYSPRTRIYEDGNAVDFVRELHGRWLSKQSKPSTASVPAGRALRGGECLEPDDMRKGSIFVSYTSEDRAAAAAIAKTLDGAGLDVWYDRNELRGGDRYDEKICHHINQCDLFVPLLSRNTESRQDAYFRREWTWASERLPAISPSRPFMLPLVIDDLNPYKSPDLKHYFGMAGRREVHVLNALNGVLDERSVQDFIDAIHQVRAPHAAAV